MGICSNTIFRSSYSYINKTIKAQGDSQSIVTDGKIPIAVINADEQEYVVSVVMRWICKESTSSP